MTKNNTAKNKIAKNKIALIDGYGFVFRAYHSLPPLNRSDGTPVGAVYGFTNMLIKLLASLDVSHIAVVFDSGSKTFRNDIYPNYKANRPPCPEDLKPQFPIIREVAEALNIAILEKVGFEADDLIATMAKLASKKDFEVVVVSSDKDLMQLVDDQVMMYDALKNKNIGADQVREKFLVNPNQVLEVLSLMGDTSDNVPGVKGIGPKTAAELINKYHNIENLFNHLDEIKQDKRREMLQNGIESAKLSKRLIALKEDVPINHNMADYQVQNIDAKKLVSFLEQQGFRSLVARVQKEFAQQFNTNDSAKPDLFAADDGGDDQKTPQMPQVTQVKQANTDSFSLVKKIIVNDIGVIKHLTKQVIENGNLVVDFWFENKILQTIILSTNQYNKAAHEVFYIQVANQKIADNDDLFSAPSVNNQKVLFLDDVIKELQPLFLDESIIKIGYHTKEIIKFLQLKTTAIEDIAVMGYVLNSGASQTNLYNLIANNLSDNFDDKSFGNAFEELEKNKIPEIFLDENKKVEFFCFKNYLLGKLYNILKQRIFSEKLNLVYYSFERPLMKVLAELEQNGIAVDQLKLKALSAEFDLRIKQLSAEIYNLAREEFNIGSPKQLADILFSKLSLKTGKKSSKTGAFSTNSDVLEELDLEGHVIAGKILEWRHISKLKSTYSDALQQQIDQKTGRIYSNFSNTSTSTGRLSSNNPNLQNIPIRSAEGVRIRQAFVAKVGHQLIAADYSQIELRVLAHMAGIASLKQAFLDDKDIHAITAAQVFGVDENKVDSEMRRKAKAINFGIIYGISAFGLAKQLRIARSDAANYIDTYFVTYPGIKEYMNHYQDLARKNGFTTTIIGRKCFIPDINSKNPTLKGLAERLAINAPIQGSAADIIKKAMIDFSGLLKEKSLNTKMILQVHDELILEVPDNEIELVTKLLKRTMEGAVTLDVPLKVDIEVSDCWG